MSLRMLPFLMLAVAAPAVAQEQGRDFCTTRPSIGTTACIVDVGRVVVELGAVDWQRLSNSDARETELLAGDALVRLGVGEKTEVQLGFAAFGRVRELDRESGERERASGFGDVTLTVRQDVRNPDGHGFSWGIQPSVTLPTGRAGVGDGTWSAGLVVPVSYELSERVQLVVDPEIDAQADENGRGRHLRYGGVAGVTVGLGEAVAVSVEMAAYRDRDPAEPVTELLSALTIAWQPTDDLQLDCGAVAGLNRETPDIRLLAGVSTRF